MVVTTVGETIAVQERPVLYASHESPLGYCRQMPERAGLVDAGMSSDWRLNIHEMLVILRYLVILARVDPADVFLVWRIEYEVLRKPAVLRSGIEIHELFRHRIDPIFRNDIAGENLTGFRRRVVGLRDRKWDRPAPKSLPFSLVTVGIVLFTVAGFPSGQFLPCEKEEQFVLNYGSAKT